MLRAGATTEPVSCSDTPRSARQPASCAPATASAAATGGCIRASSVTAASNFVWGQHLSAQHHQGLHVVRSEHRSSWSCVRAVFRVQQYRHQELRVTPENLNTPGACGLHNPAHHPLLMWLQTQRGIWQ